MYKTIEPEDLNFGNLNKVQINFVEMERQKRRICDIGNEAINKVNMLIKSINSLISLIDYTGDSVEFTLVGRRIEQRLNEITKNMENQISEYVRINDEITTEIKNILNKLINEKLFNNGIYDPSNVVSEGKLSYNEALERANANTGFFSEKKIEINGERNLKLTFYCEESGCYDITGSGFKTSDFNINENGWYTKTIKKADGTTEEFVVLAAATTYLRDNWGLSSIDGKTYYKYGDIVNFTSNGKTYQGVILDSCGSAVRSNYDWFDIFTSGMNCVNPTTSGAIEIAETVGHVEWDYGKELGILE